MPSLAKAGTCHRRTLSTTGYRWGSAVWLCMHMSHTTLVRPSIARSQGALNGYISLLEAGYTVAHSGSE